MVKEELVGFFEAFLDFGSKVGVQPRPRVLSNRAEIYVRSGDGTSTRIKVGEFDRFSARQQYDLLTRTPMGEYEPLPQMSFKGWTISMGGGKVDSNLSYLMADMEKNYSRTELPKAPGLLDQIKQGVSTVGNILQGKSASGNDGYPKMMHPVFDIVQTVVHYNGTFEQYEFKECVIHNMEIDIQADMSEIVENVTVFARRRVRGNQDGIGNPITAESIVGGVANLVTGFAFGKSSNDVKRIVDYIKSSVDRNQK